MGYPEQEKKLAQQKKEEEERLRKEEAEKKAKEEQEKSKSNEEVEVIKAPIQKVEKTMEFFEFRLFLQTLRQYYLYCQVIGFTSLDL